jgi:hypothetical protein
MSCASARVSDECSRRPEKAKAGLRRLPWWGVQDSESSGDFRTVAVDCGEVRISDGERGSRSPSISPSDGPISKRCAQESTGADPIAKALATAMATWSAESDPRKLRSALLAVLTVLEWL